MKSSRITIVSLAATALAMTGLAVPTAIADDPAPQKSDISRAAEAIKPRPPVAIPDDPPPHEGAMIDLPEVIEPPDILAVEVLEALPGRPITGDRLVRRDGMVSLGYYGDVHVRGLTREQAKVKIIMHLKKYLNDQTLGLSRFELDAGPGSKPTGDDPPPPAAKERTKEPEAGPDPAPAPGSDAEDQARPVTPRRVRRATPPPSGRGIQSRRPGRRPRSPAATPAQVPKPNEPEAAEMEESEEPRGHFITIAPGDSERVFVDISSYNSKNYFVQGDVGTPGRLPSTGNDTVLDALNFAGGLRETADPREVHLYRPAQGGKPARDYRIDLAAILHGDARANLQLFPNDRIHVGRNPIVQKTADLDRVAAPINNVLSTILQYSVSARSVGAIGLPPSGNAEVKAGGQSQTLPGGDASVMPAGRRDASMKEWFDFLWGLSSQDAGKTLDEEALREAILRKLAPPASTGPGK